jgi:hypothetical protein
MADRKDIPHLLKLMDDESPAIREAVGRELAAFGPNLEAELDALEGLTDEQVRAAAEVVVLARREKLTREWPSWLQAADEHERLERALESLSGYLSGPRSPGLRASLDALAGEFASLRGEIDAFALADFLFKSKGYSGASEDYYEPRNSDLAQVIETKKGLPISLALLYMLVGRRLGLRISGCNLPGHFMGRVETPEGPILVDCFDGGKPIPMSRLRGMADGESWRFIEPLIAKEADAPTVVARVLNNLVNAFVRKADAENEALMRGLLSRLEDALSGPPPAPAH